MGKGERTKEALAAALEDLLRERPLGKIHVRDITDRAGVDRQTFYYHFDTLTDLGAYLYRARTTALLRDLPGCADAAEMFAMVADSVEENKDALKGMLKEVGRPVMRERLHDDASRVLAGQATRMCAERGAAVDADELAFAIEYCLVASASLFVDWLDGRVEGTARDLAARLARAFEQHVEGMMAARGRA